MRKLQVQQFHSAVCKELTLYISKGADVLGRTRGACRRGSKFRLFVLRAQPLATEHLLKGQTEACLWQTYVEIVDKHNFEHRGCVMRPC